MKYAEALKKLKTAKEWNDYYYRKYGSFRVQLFLGRPNKWTNYTPKDHPKQFDDFPNHRERFVDELIIDFDGTPPDSITHGTAGFSRFKDRDIECSLWGSGGDGMHLHAFFPELRTMHPEDRKTMLEVMKKTLLAGLLRPAGLDSHVCGGKPTLYQTECCRHRKGGYKTLKNKHTTNKQNKIPNDCWKNYHINKRKKAEEAEKYAKLEATLDKGGKPAYINYLESEKYYSINDGRKRAAFIIASYYGNQEPTKHYIMSKLREWNSYTLRGNLNDQLLKSVAESVIRYHQNGGIRIPHKFARDLLEEIGRWDVWEDTLLQGGDTDGTGGNN